MNGYMSSCRVIPRALNRLSPLNIQFIFGKSKLATFSLLLFKLFNRQVDGSGNG
jgi:hypothetical protein